MESFVEQKGLSDFVYFQDYVAQDQLLFSLNTGNVMLLTQLAETEGLVVPSKIYSYMAVGKPILAICQNACEVSEIIDENQCGVTVKTGEQLARAVLTILDNAQLQIEMGNRARSAFAEKYERRRCTNRIGEILTKIIQESNTCPTVR